MSLPLYQQEKIERLIRHEKGRLYNTKMLKENRAAILRFDEENRARSLSPNTRLSYFRILRLLASFAQKPFEKLTKSEMVQFFSLLQQGKYCVKVDRLSSDAINSYKQRVKTFMRWLHGGSECPESVRWIQKLGETKNRKLPEELITPSDVKKMAEVCDNPRDRALVMVLYESGCRRGEFLDIKIKHVKFDQYGARIIVNGKTGMRQIRLIDSVPDLQLWLNHHPQRDNPEAYVWISMRSDWGKKHYTDNVIPRTILTRILKRLATRAEIKKRVYPHLFRHSIATQWAKEFTETELKILGGWCRHSKMTQVYLHLSGADVEQKLLEKRGLIKKGAGKKREEVLKPKECPRCQEPNPATAKFCLRCSLVLDQKTALELDAKMKGLDELMNIAMEQKTKQIQKGADLIDIIADKVAEKLKR